jgi:hypothetical protein
MKKTVRTKGSLVRAGRRALLVAGAFLCISVAGLAQSTNSSDLRGTVTDATGSVIPGATVSIVNTDGRYDGTDHQ